MNVRVQRLFAEVLFPTVGLIFWNWGFDFILWFYFLDQFAGLVSDVVKKNGGFVLQRHGLIIIELMVILCAIAVFTIDFLGSLMDFLSYEDMGIAQGYFLIPIMMLGEYLKINLERKTGVIWQISKRAQLIKTALFALLLVGVIFEGAELYAAVAFILILALINILFPPVLIKK
jgi:hypothetical protein